MKYLNIKITEKDLIELMKQNPNINIKEGNKLYYKDEIGGVHIYESKEI